MGAPTTPIAQTSPTKQPSLPPHGSAPGLAKEDSYWWRSCSGPARRAVIGRAGVGRWRLAAWGRVPGVARQGSWRQWRLSGVGCQSVSGGGRWLAETRSARKKVGRWCYLLGRKQSSRRRCRCEPDKSRFWRWSLESRSGESGRANRAGPPGRPATYNFFVREEPGRGGGGEGTGTLSSERRLRWR